MNTAKRPPAPTADQIDSRVSDICEFLDPPDVEDLFWYLVHRDREPSAPMIKVEKVALEFLAWREARAKGGAAFKAHGVKDRCSGDALPKETEREQKAAKVRPLADKLRDKLDDYYLSRFGIPPLTAAYSDPPESEVTAGRAEWIVYIAIPERKGWKPVIQLRARAITKPIDHSGERVDFEPVGTNIDAMRYLAKHLPLTIKIEDTAIRWDANKMPYTDLSGFRAALKESTATYRLITGPVKYKAYMEVLREVYSEKPGGNELLECFRLDQALPTMNFTILYYPAHLHRSTEVLYGYGIKEGKNSVESTMVFRTNNPDLVKEYKRLFQALREHPSSSRISAHDPDFMESEEKGSDVVATFKKFGEIPIENLARMEPCERVRLCVTCTSEIDRLIAHFKSVSMSASIQILLAHRDSPFLKTREQSLSRSLQTLVDRNLEALKGLLPRSNFTVKLTGKTMPVMLKQIGSTMIFSPFWNGKPVATGPQFMVRAGSATGSFLETQFEELWNDTEAVTADLSGSEIVVPPLQNSQRSPSA